MEIILASDALRAVVFIFLFTTHWQLAAFLQSFWWHRANTHQCYAMSEKTKKLFHILTALVTGSSFTKTWEWVALHRKHHAASDMEDDPHNTSSLLAVWRSTLEGLAKVRAGQYEEKHVKNVSRWDRLENLAASTPVRLTWVGFYVYIYWQLAFPVFWILLPVTIWLSLIQGSLVNMYGHLNKQPSNMTSRLARWFLAGEAMHQDHHENPSKPWIGEEWRKDSTFVASLILHIFGLIKIKRIKDLDLSK